MGSFIYANDLNPLSTQQIRTGQYDSVVEIVIFSGILVLKKFSAAEVTLKMTRDSILKLKV